MPNPDPLSTSHAISTAIWDYRQWCRKTKPPIRFERLEMSGDWKFVGFAEGFLAGLIPPHKYIVEHRQSGERRYIWAHNIDDIGRAISDGDWGD